MKSAAIVIAAILAIGWLLARSSPPPMQRSFEPHGLTADEAQAIVTVDEWLTANRQDEEQERRYTSKRFDGGWFVSPATLQLGAPTYVLDRKGVVTVLPGR